MFPSPHGAVGVLKTGEVAGEWGVGEVKEPASNFPVGEWGVALLWGGGEWVVKAGGACGGRSRACSRCLLAAASSHLPPGFS